MKRIIIVLCCIILLPFQMLTVYAEARLDSFAVKSVGLPREAVYMDMLISMDENDKAYTPYNEDNMKQYSFDTKTIAEYNSEGFVSMSYHYKDNFTKMKILYNNKYGYINSFVLDKCSNGGLVANDTRVHDIISEDRKFRIALLDENGNIIQLSEPFKGNSKRGLLIDYVGYDVKNNILSLRYEYNYVLEYWLWNSNPKYTIIGIIALIIIIKFLISRLKLFISKHKHSDAE